MPRRQTSGRSRVEDAQGVAAAFLAASDSGTGRALGPAIRERLSAPEGGPGNRPRGRLSGGRVAPRGAFRARALGAVLALGLLGALAPACSDRSRRMGEFETLQYKRGLIAEHREEISPSQAEKLMYFPGRTPEEIDAYVDDLRGEFAKEQEAERERLRPRSEE